MVLDLPARTTDRYWRVQPGRRSAPSGTTATIVDCTTTILYSITTLVKLRRFLAPKNTSGFLFGEIKLLVPTPLLLAIWPQVPKGVLSFFHFYSNIPYLSGLNFDLCRVCSKNV